MMMTIQEVVEERPTDIYSAIEAANDKYDHDIEYDKNKYVHDIKYDKDK